jgi:hypothetical protein
MAMGIRVAGNKEGEGDKEGAESATRAECNKERNGFGGKSNGDKGGPPCLGDVGLSLFPTNRPLVFKI